jgi:hypothetical protein
MQPSLSKEGFNFFPHIKTKWQIRYWKVRKNSWGISTPFGTLSYWKLK